MLVVGEKNGDGTIAAVGGGGGAGRCTLSVVV